MAIVHHDDIRAVSFRQLCAGSAISRNNNGSVHRQHECFIPYLGCIVTMQIKNPRAVFGATVSSREDKGLSLPLNQFLRDRRHDGRLAATAYS
jgi:hypothetical protein